MQEQKSTNPKLSVPSQEKSKIRKLGTNKLRNNIIIFLAILVFVGIIGGGIYLYTNSSLGSSGAPQEEDPVDNRELEVNVIRPEREVLNPFTEVTIVANKPITFNQHNRVSQFKDLGGLDGNQYYVANIINLPVDTTKVTIRYQDAAGNEGEQSLEITRKQHSFPAGYASIGPWPEAEYTLDGDSYDAVVDKQHRLLEDYEPDDLVDLNKELGLYTLNNAQLRGEAATALKGMLDAMAKDIGKYVTIASGYRSYETQVTTYSHWVRQLGEKKANTLSAKPGHSEHQLGTTIDLVSDETNWQITNKFGSTAAGKWLAKHSKEYGFVQPYKTDESKDGGYKEESWHFRYVGVE